MSVMLSPARRPQTDGGHFEGRRSVDFAHFLSQASQAAGRQAGAIVLSWKIAMKCFCGREICELRRPCSRLQYSQPPPLSSLQISLVCLPPPRCRAARAAPPLWGHLTLGALMTCYYRAGGRASRPRLASRQRQQNGQICHVNRTMGHGGQIFTRSFFSARFKYLSSSVPRRSSWDRIDIREVSS